MELSIVDISLSADLKLVSDGHADGSNGSTFQSLMVRGKNVLAYAVVLACGMWYLE